jgi:hypothetical protein
LRARHLNIPGERFGQQEERFSGGVQGLVEAGGEEAGFETGGAQKRLLGEGDALHGEEFLGIDRLVHGHQVRLETADFLKVFQPDHGEGRRRKAVLAGVLGGARLAAGSAGSGGAGGVGSIGSELFGGDGFVGFRHGVDPLPEKEHGAREVVRDWRRQVRERKGLVRWPGRD